jgi:hypothetical protein
LYNINRLVAEAATEKIIDVRAFERFQPSGSFSN